ncbi:hypothetical protein ACGFMM_12055 [Streptomyces sp. NPDC048604]|uniref:hypothetical protein n=1 Tax=Streptomyces sp. NPDC048604 TaxID=3365578 RepID=UPI003715C015
MARHAATSPRRSLLRTAGLTVTAAGAVLGLGGAAQAATAPVPLPVGTLAGSDTTEAAQGVVDALPYAVAPVKDLQLDPLANTGVDPLDNGVGTQVADFQPVSTTMATDPVTKGGSLGTLPVVGEATGLLPL